MKVVEIRKNVWLNTDKITAIYLSENEKGWQFVFHLDNGKTEKSMIFNTNKEAKEWLIKSASYVF